MGATSVLDVSFLTSLHPLRRKLRESITVVAELAKVRLNLQAIPPPLDVLSAVFAMISPVMEPVENTRRVSTVQVTQDGIAEPWIKVTAQA